MSEKAPARRTQRERREDTTRRLIAATIETLLEVGYAKTTVKAICLRAGLSHGALFRFYPTVLDLVLAAAEEVAARQIAEFERRFAEAESSQNPLATALRLLRDTCRSPTNAVFYELLVAARTDHELHRALEPGMQRYYASILAAAREVPGASVVPAEMFEMVLFTAIHVFDGESLARVVLPRDEVAEQRLEMFVKLASLLPALGQLSG